MTAIHLSRLFLDLQHLEIMGIGLAMADVRQSVVTPSFFTPNEFKYDRIIEYDDQHFGNLSAVVTRIHFASPLFVETAVKVSKSIGRLAANHLHTIADRFFFGDLERKKRSLELGSLREDVRAKRIQNIEAAFNLAQKIPDQDLRRQFAENLINSIYPFLEDHPPILELEADIGEEDQDF